MRLILALLLTLPPVPAAHVAAWLNGHPGTDQGDVQHLGLVAAGEVVPVAGRGKPPGAPGAPRVGAVGLAPGLQVLQADLATPAVAGVQGGVLGVEPDRLAAAFALADPHQAVHQVGAAVEPGRDMRSRDRGGG